MVRRWEETIWVGGRVRFRRLMVVNLGSGPGPGPG